MPKTPDRRPGPSEEDVELRFDANPIPPTVQGAINYDGNNFVFYDQLGYFNPREGIFTVSGGFANTPYSASFGSGSYVSDIGTDVFFFVSGSPGSIGTTFRGVVAFGGDLVVTGSSRFVGGLSGSLTKLVDGTSYLIQSGNITITSASNGAVTIGTTAINSTEHARLRQLIHFVDEGGPFEGFTAGSYREILPAGDPFPTSVIWWEDSSKVKKIVEETITYNSLKLITTDEWKVYNTDGVTVVATATDTINYSGAFETNRTRTIT